jgi:membrane protein YqaA with SNARE-associated domain
MQQIKKPNWLRRLYDWTVSWSETRYGAPALGVISFTESSFFPIPPDVLLIALCFGSPQRWLRFALICTVASVLGGVFGWAIGSYGWHLLADWFYSWVPGFTPEVFAIVESKYQAGAFIALLAAAFTPIPYKVFTVASGVFAVGLPTLVIASLIGRGLRFFAVAGIIRVGGPQIRPLLEKYFEWAALLLFVLALLGFLAIRWFVQ